MTKRTRRRPANATERTARVLNAEANVAMPKHVHKKATFDSIKRYGIKGAAWHNKPNIVKRLRKPASE